MELQIAATEDFDSVYDALEASFIPEERRDREDAHRLMLAGKYTVFHVLDGDCRVGFLTVWELDGFAFVEHFVTYEKYRNCGYGSAALGLLKGRYDSIVLEAEPPTEGMPARRIAFYERNGFCRNKSFYLQPPYRATEAGVELVLMSYPTALDDFHGVAGEIYGKVYGKKYCLDKDFSAQ